MSIFKKVRAYLPNRGVVRADIEFTDGMITSVTPHEDDEALEKGGELVLPGFIDEHIHGAGGADAMDASQEALSTISRCLAREGTTAFLATTMTQSEDAICKALKAVEQTVKSGSADGAALLGVHLEGPFISPKYIGAQPSQYIQKPTKEQFDRYQKAADGMIRMVSLAPEVDGAPELTAYLAQNGVAVSAGHSGAGYADVMRAVERGLSSVTHTYNAQSSVHHREIGVVGAAMLCDALYTELICDTIHVSIPAIQLMLRSKPQDKVILITDSMRAKGIADGVSELGGQTVYVKNGEARLADGTLAGSVLKMNDAIRNLVTRVGVPLSDAVRYATENPAKHLGVYHERGSIEVGKRADFTILDQDFNVVKTIVGGKTVFSR